MGSGFRRNDGAGMTVWASPGALTIGSLNGRAPSHLRRGWPDSA